MKILMLVVTLAFVTAMFVRIVEMSIQFDGVDILWAAIFLTATIISAAGYSAAEWND